jgi:dienelactone hydrolase
VAGIGQHSKIHILLPGILSVVALLTAGCQTAEEVKGSMGEVERAWRYGQHRLPRGALKDGQFYALEEIREYPDAWPSAVAETKLRPGSRLPAVIYLHGCAGNTAGESWARTFSRLGYAFFAPNSLARPRKSLCGTGRTRMITERIPMRTEEALYALQQLRKADWIDQRRIVLMGSSEGAQAASVYRGTEFAAIVLSATDCRFSGGSPKAPPGVSVLNMVGENDRQGGASGCPHFRRKEPGSMRVVIKGAGHKLAAFPEAQAELKRFLEECCANSDSPIVYSGSRPRFVAKGAPTSK